MTRRKLIALGSAAGVASVGAELFSNGIPSRARARLDPSGSQVPMASSGWNW